MNTTLLVVLTGLVLAAGIALLIAWLFSASVAKNVAAALPPAGRFVAVEGGRLHIIEKGEGPPIVMIHGLGGNLHNFTYALVDRLAADHRVIAVDRPGSGWSTRDSDEQARLPQQARMIAEMMAAEGLERPLVVGHSLGGAIALALAVNHSDQVGALALISPLASAPDAPADVFKGLAIADPGLRTLVAHTVAVPLSIRNGEKTLAVVFGPDAAPDDFRTRGGGLLGLRPRAFYATSTDFNAIGQDLDALQARYGEIAVPAGVVYGTEDKLLDAETQIAALRAALPAIEVETVTGHGHMPLIVLPDETEAFVRKMAGKA